MLFARAGRTSLAPASIRTFSHTLNRPAAVYSRSHSSHADARLQWWYPRVTGIAAGALAIGILGYQYSGRLYLDDSALRSKPLNAVQGASPDTPVGQARTNISYSEVQEHASRKSCWVIISGEVYDVTNFLNDHPGGVNAILRMAGRDATEAFKPIHPPGTLSLLDPASHVGSVDPETMPEPSNDKKEELDRIAAARLALPPPEAAVNLYDIERLAKTVLTKTAWAYYSSAGDDEYSHRENTAAFRRFWFRPRVLNKVSQVSTRSKLWGQDSELPVYVSPAAMARLGHPDGEMEITRACAKEGVIQGISANASCSLDEIVGVRKQDQPLVYQLYMNRNRELSKEIIQKVDGMGFRGIILTVDAPVPGKRERDIRAQGEDFQGPASNNGQNGEGKGVAQAISGYQDPDVNWGDIAWIKSLTKLPVYIKGIQCVEDAEKAYKYGVQGIVLSNHGGRQLDFAPASMTVLYELYQRRPDLLKKMDVYLDGGARRGTDVLKALCLGAKGVGIGRPVLYGNGCWGENGVRRVFQIMREEMETGMRLLGVTRIEDLKPEMVQYVDRDPVPIVVQADG